MPAKVHRILRRKGNLIPNWLGDFTEDFEVENAGVIATSELLSPQYSLYCLNLEKKVAVIAETPPECNLASRPFYNIAQLENATSLVTLPLHELTELGNSQHEPERLIFLQNVGRCGSTLLHQAFNQIPGMRSLSEPDLFQTLQVGRPVDRSEDKKLLPLLRAATKYLCRPLSPSDMGVVIKARMPAIHMDALLAEAFPAAKRVFLYRDVVPWAKSVHRALGPLNDDFNSKAFKPGLSLMKNFKLYERLNPGTAALLLRNGGLSNSIVQGYGAAWIRALEAYEERAQQGHFFALRYEELVSHPEEAVTALFEECGIDTVHVPAALAAFEQDSQEGTILARASLGESKALEAEEVQKLIDFIEKQPVINRTDYKVSQLWQPAA